MSDTKTDYGYGYNDTNSIAIIWSIEDVKEIRPDLDDEACMDVLGYVQNKHDATIGVSWETLEIHSEYLFPQEIRRSNG
jgi:hypothetical protein|tara:strand:- start:173 stop:409 length:237 start_codon:yes stop_codon:yes gene_type:complete